ncbi:fungal-specific transcription factor domain-containing protein [Phyllosticta citrichinensis]
MLSNGLHQYHNAISAFNQLPSSNILSPEQPLSSSRFPSNGLDALASTSQYALHQYPHTPQVLSDGKSFVKQRHHPYINGPASSAARNKPMTAERSGRNSSAPVRRRISRACDQCNQLRTKCDGKAPCAHCIEFGLTCEYLRERKKRGKASRKDIAAAQAAAAAAVAESGQHGSPRREDRQEFSTPQSASSNSMPLGNSVHYDMNQRYESVSDTSDAGSHQMSAPTDIGLATPRLSNNGFGQQVNMSDYGSMDDFRAVSSPAVNVSFVLPSSGNVPHHRLLTTNGMPNYNENFMLSPTSQHGQNGFRMQGESPMNNFLGNSPAETSPGWMSLPSPSMATLQSNRLRYPVLQPLVPHISGIVPVDLACDLLESYFKSTKSTFMQPVSPYVLGYVFRKRSFLRHSNPRTCSPALLASMLWIGAQTHESAFLTSPPSSRGQVCQNLLEVTIGLLKPLIHNPDASTNTVINGVALGGFGVTAGKLDDDRGATPGASGALDDIATYIHLAVVVSASEYKAASLRWWNAAWSLARELKLSRELPQRQSRTEDEDSEGEVDMELNIPPTETVSEEEREERRRIWWLLYTMDRHLALCYNRPLFLLDVECEELLQPVNETNWQAGEFYEEPDEYRRRGPSIEVSGHSIFGYFLPCMTILGGIIDLVHARNHPRFGNRFSGDDYATEIIQQLDTYESSLGELGTDSSPESVMQTKIVVAYATHLLHTLHILLNGKWDPISLLDDNDLWISSQSFVTATSHAVSAAEALSDVLEYDPDLSFMPFFFGIYLLQGSFLLLLIADKLQGEASPNVVKACETIVRAHEACVVTLNTEYQRNFRKVMRSALAQVRGHCQDLYQQQRRREVLALYRWTGDGTGLAL